MLKVSLRDLRENLIWVEIYKGAVLRARWVAQDSQGTKPDVVRAGEGFAFKANTFGEREDGDAY